MKKQTSEVLNLVSKLELGNQIVVTKDGNLKVNSEKEKVFSVADMWNIHRQHRSIFGRRNFLQ